jgi:glycosyltransferase involved in cell wall biosynthesis
MSSPSKPLLSIVIATKNRQKYLVSAVESILSINDDRIQVVVQDNSDLKDLEEKLSKFITDSRLVYRYTPPPFSSIDNFNASVELSTGEYICLIGDDDGINPELIKVAEWAQKNNVDSVVGSLSANYRWEGSGAPDTLFTKMTGGTLTMTHFDGKVKVVDIEQSLLQLMHNGCTNYLDYSLPKLYHGIVRRKCMEEIKNKIGDTFIKGLSPDIYSAIALSCVVNKLVTVDYPITIPGVCGQSTSITEGQLKTHSKKLEDAPHFRDRGPYDWSQQVPRIYCVQTIWGDSGFAALRDMGRTDLIAKFNRFRLYANIISADSTLKSEVNMHMKSVQKQFQSNDIKDFMLLQYASLTGPFKNFILKRVLGRLKIILGLRPLKNLEDLADMQLATNALTAYLKTKKIDVLSILETIN